MHPLFTCVKDEAVWIIHGNLSKVVFSLLNSNRWLIVYLVNYLIVTVALRGSSASINEAIHWHAFGFIRLSSHPSSCTQWFPLLYGCEAHKIYSSLKIYHSMKSLDKIKMITETSYLVIVEFHLYSLIKFYCHRVIHIRSYTC